MKKIVLYIIVGLIAVTCVYNTYKITIDNKVVNKTIREEYDSSSIDKKIDNLNEENQKLTNEINQLKEENTKLVNRLNEVETKTNNIITPKNYDNEINNLKEENNRLKDDYSSIINCLFTYNDGNIVITNMGVNNGPSYVFMYSNERCKSIKDWVH